MTLRNAAAADVRLIVWRRDGRHQVEPDPAEHASRCGAEVTVLEWGNARLFPVRKSPKVDILVSVSRSPIRR